MEQFNPYSFALSTTFMVALVYWIVTIVKVYKYQVKIKNKEPNLRENVILYLKWFQEEMMIGIAVLMLGIGDSYLDAKKEDFNSFSDIAFLILFSVALVLELFWLPRNVKKHLECSMGLKMGVSIDKIVKKLQ